jgi:predicted HicB family RNase H-like nuclease
MKDVLVFKDYTGSVRFNADDEVFFGKIEGIEDLMSFEGDSIIELKTGFEEAVNDYLEICKNNGEKNKMGDLMSELRQTSTKKHQGLL